jgi:A/G-specific adenine glycosylase
MGMSTDPNNKATFSDPLLAWFGAHGRKELPWQYQPRDPYRVWVSEIMLQQTQVATVIGYFQRFMAAFPNIKSLAKANQDEVLHYWSGLGYYARARNLHRCAKMIVKDHQGIVPKDLEVLQNLPGIGRSTAGAIRSLAYGEFAPILDGNVKRVLTRYFAIDGWPGGGATLKALWQLSEQLTPQHCTADYNQAMMDLGAMVCVRNQPACSDCPLRSGCQAYVQGETTRYPAAKPKKARPVRYTQLLILSDANGRILLEQRPPVGIWGGLWSLPECAIDVEAATWCQHEMGYQVTSLEPLVRRRHSFSHFHLEITPVLIFVKNPTDRLMDAGAQVWYNLSQPDDRGLAAPVLRILQEIEPRILACD